MAVSSAESATRRAPGPARRFGLAEIDAAALRVVEQHGFAGLSLRAVARELGVTAAALYTYLSTGDELRERVIDRVVAQHAAGIRWPDEWADVLRTFALGLRDMLAANPAMIEAFAAGAVLTPAARDVAERVMHRLVAAGLEPAAAFRAYATVHSLVMGHSLLRAGAGGADQPPRIDASRHPTLALLEDRGGVGRLPLEGELDIVIAGIRASLAPDG